VNPVQLEACIICCQGPRTEPGCNWAGDHLLLLLLRLTLFTLSVLLVLLLISRPGKGGIPIIIPISRLTCTLLLRYTPGALLLKPGCTVTPASSCRTCSLPGRHILTGLLAADIFVSLPALF
jgi:hypothetical protein